MTVHESICSYSNVAKFSTALTAGPFYSCVNWKLNATSKTVIRDYLEMCDPTDNTLA